MLLACDWHLSFLYMKVPDAFQKLIDNVENTMRHAIVEEENIPMETVTNFDEVSTWIGVVNDPLQMFRNTCLLTYVHSHIWMFCEWSV